MAKIGKYELLEEIGSGAMGVVYKAYDPLIGREVAIKVIAERVLAIPDLKERFYREARSVGQLYHENITIVHDVGEFEGKPYLVMEYLAGLDLHELIDRQKNLPLLQKLDYARQICRGLQYAHDKDIVHRDIKPENIKVLDDGKVKIMDFGVARPSNSELTTSGMLLGTPWYMSPEQVTGGKLDRRSDIFSFGVLLYELLAARKPFEGNVTTVIYKIVHDQPAPLALGNGGLGEDLLKLLAKCLAKKPEERYSDCAVIIQDLEALIAKAREQEQKLKTLLAQAETFMAQEKFPEALAALEQILQLDSAQQEAEALKQKCLEQLKPPETTKPSGGKMIGTTISRYKILAPLGAGGMGVVYKAEDTRLKRPVALKFLAPQLTRDAAAKERFIREAQAASALDHPNICTIYEIDESSVLQDLPLPDGQRQLFISMAYYDGQTLKEKIAGSRLSLAESVEFAVQIAQGLAKAHAHGIVHRDIKPANIMITKDGLVKILDFGLAKLTGASRITRSGMTAGTLSYMSPEQAQNFDIDHRSDIWSLGVILYQAVTGQLPFGGEYELAILYSIVNEDPTPAFQLTPNLPAELERIINRAMQKPVDDRYASMQQMFDDLKNVQRRFFKKKEHEFSPLPEEVENLVAKGKFYLEKNEYNEALSRFRAALELSPQNREVKELIAAGERRQKEIQQINKSLQLAQKAYEKGNYDEARQAVNEILALDPSHAVAKELLEKIQQALERLETIDKLFADAEFYLKKEKYARAEETYKEILKLDPANKNAERGLQKATKSLPTSKPESQLSAVAVIRDLTPDKAPPPSRGKAKVIAFATVVVVGIAVSWFLWLKPGATNMAGEPNELAERARIANQDMLNLKSAAQAAGAEQWVLPAYQVALQEEERGNTELGLENWVSASQAYEAAAENFRRAAEEAKTKATMAAASLNQIKESAERTRQEMSGAKATAEKAGAKTKAKALFDRASTKEQEGNKKLAAHDRAGYQEAQKFFVEARDDYKQAGAAAEAATVVVLSGDAATAARNEMLAAKQQISGSEADKNANPNYLKAEEAAASGERQWRATDYGAARDSFQQAKEFYRRANDEQGATALKKRAADAQTSMREARAKVDKRSYTETKYREAEQVRGEAEAFYSAGSFADAAEKFKSAETLYFNVAREAAEKFAKEMEAESAVQKQIEDMIGQFKANLEKRDLPGLKTLYGKTFTKEDQKSWQDFFDTARDIRVGIEIVNREISGARATVRFVTSLRFYNTTENSETSTRLPVKSWTLEKNNDTWIISKQESK